ncbi:ArsR/SmtB family transcription factor [Halorubrum halodurans]|uniref:Transcriptional regulator n=1 Tax=Halorubrum halodurans TaxID=1383851 RepID=A0A256IPN2_9EURY|nr:winged helix-turn-helix domain-containing protein [Halorubrum halodurans]OYR58403.1 transcriptional regulator [Halorubrum halodurans]
MSQSTGGAGRRESSLRRSPVEYAPKERIDVALDPDGGADALSVVSSETAREILAELADDPKTASGIAERMDTSVQSVTYHLDRLVDAGVIGPVETWYSRKGREMTVYGVESEKLVIDLGADDGGVESDRSA